jgi:hypothetical protein
MICMHQTSFVQGQRFISFFHEIDYYLNFTTLLVRIFGFKQKSIIEIKHPLKLYQHSKCQ